MRMSVVRMRALTALVACTWAGATFSYAQAQSPQVIVTVPSQAGTARLSMTVGTDGVGRDCQVLTSSGSASDDALACRFFSRAGHEIKRDGNGRAVEYQKQFGVAPTALMQLREVAR